MGICLVCVCVGGGGGSIGMCVGIAVCSEWDVFAVW